MRQSIVFLVVISMFLVNGPWTAVAATPGNVYFQRTWERTDQPVAAGAVSRTWMWGPEANSPVLWEPYHGSGDHNYRHVQYFDKSRMEITHPNGDPNSIWYVTNGLLVVELVTGRLQRGDALFEQFEPAQVDVAGDGGNLRVPDYADIVDFLDRPRSQEGTLVQDYVGTWVSPEGERWCCAVGDGIDRIDTYNVHVETFVPETEHWVAGPFWEFMNSTGLIAAQGKSGYEEGLLFENPFFATGFPITEPYWVTAMVGGVQKDVLFQCFERRCLTFTPTNPPEWQVEAGNVGQHYYQWRYEQLKQPLVEPPPTS